MQLPKSLAGWICCASIAALVLAGCSRNEVKKDNTIPDTAQTRSIPKPKKKLSRGSQYDTLWDRLFALYALPPIEHPDIDRELDWFANHPAYLERAQNRAEPFLYSIVKLVEKKNVPGEIALLPIVESAFQPNVVSPARAAGIWQFIPSTGSNYGLKRSHSYDGRRDVYASTKAAIKYLKKLHGDFDDWLLAIAAYNCGEGAVARAIRRNEGAGLPTDFWSLNLPQETRAYVPKLLAVSRLFADADKYGISLKDLPNMAQYKPVKVSNQLDLALAADAAGMSLDKLYELNPGFRGQYADVDGSYHLYIPANKKAAEFRKEVERLSQTRRSYDRPEFTAEPEPMPVEPGAFQSFRREFERRPPPPPTKSSGGRFIPMSFAADGEGYSDPAPPSRHTRRRDKPPVVPAIEAEAQDYSMPDDTALPVEPVAPLVNRTRAKPTPKRLAKSPPAVVERTANATPAVVAETRKRPAVSSYSVEKGETLYSVARKHNISVSQLAKWNAIPITTEVQAGQRLAVTESAKKNSTASNNATARPASVTKAVKPAATAKAPGRPAGDKPDKPTATESKRRVASNPESRKLAANAR